MEKKDEMGYQFSIVRITDHEILLENDKDILPLYSKLRDGVNVMLRTNTYITDGDDPASEYEHDGVCTLIMASTTFPKIDSGEIKISALYRNEDNEGDDE